MSLQSDELLGVQTPQILLRPIDVVSLVEAQEAIELADAYGLCRGNPLDESQRLTLEVGMGTRSDGTWAARTMADFEPRQNGKNDSCAAREFHGLINMGGQLMLHTAHEAKTAKQSFERLVAVFEAWDDIRAKVRNIRYANGEQGIYMRDGGSLLYMTRTGAAGRGFAEADLVVYDEAQHLQAEHVAASGPTKLANPNSQSWYMGSGGMIHSANAWRLRKRALKGIPGRFGYVEHTAERVSLVNGKVVSIKPDIMDRRAWAEANAAYGYRISDENFLELLEEIGPDLFARECLNLWDPELDTAGVAIPAALWAKVRVPDAEPSGRQFIALHQSFNPNLASVAVAGGGVVALVEPRPSHDELVPVVLRLAEVLKAPVVFDPSGPASSVKSDLERAGVEIVEVGGQSMVQACGLMLRSVSDGTIRVRRHPDLDKSAENARILTRSNGGWVWDWKGSVDPSPIVAATLAWWAASQAGPPKKQMFVY